MLKILETFRKKKVSEFETYNEKTINILNFRTFEMENLRNHLSIIENLTNFSARGITHKLKFEEIEPVVLRPYLEKTELLKIYYLHEYEVAGNKFPKKRNHIYAINVNRNNISEVFGEKYFLGMFLIDSPVKVYPNRIKITTPTVSLSFNLEINQQKVRALHYIDAEFTKTELLATVLDIWNDKDGEMLFKEILNYSEKIFGLGKFGENVLKDPKEKIRSMLKSRIKEVEKLRDKLVFLCPHFENIIVDVDTIENSAPEILNSIYNRLIFGIPFVANLVKSEFKNPEKINSIKDILKYSIEELLLTGKYKEYEMDDDSNIRFRRIIFLEKWITQPLLYATMNFIVSGSEISEFNENNITLNVESKLKETILIKHFNRRRIHYWDFPTPYYGARACVLLNYEGKEDTPFGAKQIHDSQYNIICPIATSSQKPGIVIHSLPEAQLDEYGRFKEIFYPI